MTPCLKFCLNITHLNESGTLITVMSELFFGEGFSLGHVIITTIISKHSNSELITEISCHSSGICKYPAASGSRGLAHYVNVVGSASQADCDLEIDGGLATSQKPVHQAKSWQWGGNPVGVCLSPLSPAAQSQSHRITHFSRGILAGAKCGNDDPLLGRRLTIFLSATCKSVLDHIVERTTIIRLEIWLAE